VPQECVAPMIKQTEQLDLRGRKEAEDRPTKSARTKLKSEMRYGNWSAPDDTTRPGWADKSFDPAFLTAGTGTLQVQPNSGPTHDKATVEVWGNRDPVGLIKTPTARSCCWLGRIEIATMVLSSDSHSVLVKRVVSCGYCGIIPYSIRVFILWRPVARVAGNKLPVRHPLCALSWPWFCGRETLRAIFIPYSVPRIHNDSPPSHTPQSLMQTLL